MRNLSSLPVSTTIRANWKEVLSVTTVAAALCLWNDAEAAAAALSLGPDAVAFAKSLPELSLPGLPFTVSSASLSLLLVFRTNKAYERWWEARCIWGAIINTCRDIVRQSLVRMDPQDMALKAEVTRLVSAFPRSLIYHVGERTDISNLVLEKKYRKILTDEETDKLLKCTHKPMTVTGMLADAVHRAKLPVIDEMKIDQDITKFSDYYGMCERIFKTPIPLSYTRLTSRFLSIWLLTLPLALYAAITPHWLIIPITAIIAFFIFGIEEIAFQIEEPFSALAMNAMADGIDASIFEALELEKKDPFTFKPRDGADAQPQKFAAFFSKPAAPPREAGVAIEAEPELAAASTVVKNVEGRFRFAASAAPAQDGDASEAPVQPSDAPEDSLVYPTNHALTVPKRTDPRRGQEELAAPARRQGESAPGPVGRVGRRVARRGAASFQARALPWCAGRRARRELSRRRPGNALAGRGEQRQGQKWVPAPRRHALFVTPIPRGLDPFPCTGFPS
ncbi:unnamed protein product [Prorocentrum cordatum]|uniref:Bestrophin homolog n=1 Tax=Prorocentrum cordatum TaxID=2364126 RepID=A0ABN9VAU0_9DINO|nr:unnamed protein product [Polarella glacialis]